MSGRLTDVRGVDFHCHVDLYSDYVGLIAECDREQILTLAVTTTPKAWSRNRELAADSRYVHVGLGLHPQLVGERADELPLLERYLDSALFIGEVGLDASPRHYRTFAEQERVFERILEVCAEAGGKILSIHSVRCASKVLGYLEKHLLPDHGRAVMHWFTGSASEAARAASLGCYFSVNDAMLKAAKSRQVIAQLPLDRLLTETDGPFVMVNDRPARPRDTTKTLAGLAAARGMKSSAMAEIVEVNAARLQLVTK